MSRIVFILQYHHSRATGGAEQQAWLLATELRRRGWESHYVFSDGKHSRAELAGVTLHGLPDELSAWHGTDCALHRLLSELRPDVTYTRAFDVYAACGNLAAPDRALSIWAAASRYDSQAWPYLAFGWKYQSLWHFLKRSPRHVYYNHLSRRGRARADLVLAQTADQQQDFAKLGIRAEILRNSHSPIPESSVQRHEGKPLILWADSVKRLKRPWAFLDLARRCRDVDADFLMIGRLHDDIDSSRVHRTARECPNFTFGDFVPLEQVNAVFQRAHLHVKTSLPFEGFPNTFIQSWLHGVPVVSWEADPDSLIERNQLGIRVSRLDELEHAVRALCSNADRRRQLGANARAFAVNEFDLMHNVDRLETLIAAAKSRKP
ncbi:glycosyltransferase family 4 protein [candidate division KSB1 bacterium]|nr:glycosyltransferase family 4 protein [candidate division KSB1 bacterium]